MKKVLVNISILLLSMPLWSCNNDIPDTPSEPGLKKIAIMGDSYSTFEGWSNKDMAGNDNDY